MTGSRASSEASGRLRSAPAFREKAVGRGSHAGEKAVFVSADMIDHQLDAAARNEDADDGRTAVLFHQQLPYQGTLPSQELTDSGQILRCQPEAQSLPSPKADGIFFFERGVGDIRRVPTGVHNKQSR